MVLLGLARGFQFRREAIIHFLCPVSEFFFCLVSLIQRVQRPSIWQSRAEWQIVRDVGEDL